MATATHGRQLSGQYHHRTVLFAQPSDSSVLVLAAAEDREGRSIAQAERRLHDQVVHVDQSLVATPNGFLVIGVVYSNVDFGARHGMNDHPSHLRL